MAQKRRATIGQDPLDELFSTKGTGASKGDKGRPRRASTRSASKGAKGRTATSPQGNREASEGREKGVKVKATYLLPAPLVNEARDAVVALSGPPVRLTLAALVETALRRELDRLRKTHHQGEPFPPHGAPLVGGRPIGR